MTRILFSIAFALGAAAIAWTAAIFVGNNHLALAVTLAIAIAFLLGFHELFNYRRATTSLSNGLSSIPRGPDTGKDELNQWLQSIDPSLHNAVQQRIEGERTGLPAPVMTPYLVGLLVMLGLLGTFIGMVDTLQGAVFALQGTTELQAIRDGLTAPINGLSLAFGTSVAGVAASAMLGLASTLCRRERMLVTSHLDDHSAAAIPQFSLAHNQREAYRALQQQAQVLPDVAARLDALADSLQGMGTGLADQLNSNQGQFHTDMKLVYTELAQSVDTSLRESLGASAQLAGDSIKPAIDEAMAGISEQAIATHELLASTSEAQFASLSERFIEVSSELGQTWQQSDQERLAQWNASFEQSQQQSLTRFGEAASEVTAQLRALAETQGTAMQACNQQITGLSAELNDGWRDAAGQMQSLTQTVSAELSQLRDDEVQRAAQTAESLAKLEASAAEQLAQLGRELEQPMTRLIETASETPRAAAEVIGQLRSEISATIERDKQLLEDRQQVMTQLNTLSESLSASTNEQHKSLASLVDNSTRILASAGDRFNERLDQEQIKLSEAAATVSSSSVEMGSMAAAFGTAIEQFSESNSELLQQLARIESAMGDATARSDEQMAYYVSQAREIIDQSLASQREVFEELREIGQDVAVAPAEAG